MNTGFQREGILQRRSALQISAFIELQFYSLSALISASETHQCIDTLRSTLQKAKGQGKVFFEKKNSGAQGKTVLYTMIAWPSRTDCTNSSADPPCLPMLS